MSCGFSVGQTNCASGAIDSSSSRINQSRTAAFVFSSSSSDRDSSSSPTRRSSTSASNSGVGEGSGFFGGRAGFGTDNRVPQDGQRAISAGTEAPQYGHSRSASE